MRLYCSVRRLFVIIVVLGVIAAGVYAFIQQAANASTQRPNIRTAKVDRGELLLTVNATGTVAPEQSVKLSFDTPGLVQEVLIEEGQHVIAGQILTRQDDGAQKLALVEAQSNLKVAELTLKAVTSPVNDKDIAVAQANIDAAKGAYNALFQSISPNAIHAAELRYQEAVTAAQDAVTHRKAMGGQFSTNSPTYQLALAQEGQAAFVAEINRLQLELLKRGPDSRAVSAAKAQITVAQARLEQLKVGVPQLQIDQAQLAVDQAKLGVEQAQRQLDNTILRAPFSGIVSAVTVKAGSLSLNNVPAIALTDTSQLHVNVKVDESDIGLLHSAQTVRLSLDALPNITLEGTIDRIALTANLDKAVVTYDVRVHLKPADAPVRVGMTANATIVIRSLVNVVRVPNLFVRLDRRSNQAFVNLVNPEGALTEVQVQLGLRTEEFSEVIAGLNEGDTIGIDLNAGGFSLF